METALRRFFFFGRLGKHCFIINDKNAKFFVQRLDKPLVRVYNKTVS